MHYTIWLATITLLASSASAFFPHVSTQRPGSAHYGNGNERQITFPAFISDGKKGDLDKLTFDLKKRPVGRRVKRSNNYPIIVASKPDLPNSLAIDEDGQDYSYFSSVQFGSSGKSMLMLMDTGAANTWVMGSDCTSAACASHNTFGKADSNTLNVTTSTWSIAYGTGSVDGVMISDNVAFAGYKVELEFGSASSTSNDFESYPMDGIMGLGRADASSLEAPTVMDTLKNLNLLKSNIFGIHLQRNSDGATDGQITFGEVDTSKFVGDITYTQAVSTSGIWEIPADGAGVDGVSCNLTGKTAIIDTGTSYLLMPPHDAKALHSLIPESTSNGESYEIPCSSTATVQFTFSGATYRVEPKDYIGKGESGSKMCPSYIIGHQAFGPNTWLMGDVFLKNVYSVFDFDENRIGFGAKTATSTTTSLTSSTSTSTGGSTATPTAFKTALIPASKATAPSTASASSIASSGGGSLFNSMNSRIWSARIFLVMIFVIFTGNLI